MHTAEDRTERLFSYGTLQLPSVQIANFGRLLEGKPDVLTGYTLGKLAITDPEVIEQSGETHHPILYPSGNPQDEIAGVWFMITPAELAQADIYEDVEYRRVLATLKSGVKAWVYIAA